MIIYVQSSWKDVFCWKKWWTTVGQVPSSKSTVRPCQIGFGRLVSTKNWWYFLGRCEFTRGQEWHMEYQNLGIYIYIYIMEYVEWVYWPLSGRFLAAQRSSGIRGEIEFQDEPWQILLVSLSFRVSIPLCLLNAMEHGPFVVKLVIVHHLSGIWMG